MGRVQIIGLRDVDCFGDLFVRGYSQKLIISKTLNGELFLTLPKVNVYIGHWKVNLGSRSNYIRLVVILLSIICTCNCVQLILDNLDQFY